MGWKDTIQDEKTSWRDTITPDVANISKLESLGRGIAQGASLGFSDELVGAGQTGYDTLLGDEKFNSFVDNYVKHRDESRLANEAAQKANPKTYGAGEIGGGLATAIIPGTTLAKGASMAAKIGMGTAQGALAGEGMSNANTIQGQAIDTALGAGLGGVMPVALEKAVIPSANYILKGGKYVAEQTLPKLGKVLAGVDEKATLNYLKNRSDVNNSKTVGELADTILNPNDSDSTLNEFRQIGSDMSSRAWGTLKNDQTVPKKILTDLISQRKEKLLTNGVPFGDVQKAALARLEGTLADINNLPDAIPEPLAKDIIQKFDDNINWNNKELGPSNEAYKALRRGLDSELKSQNPEYQQAMRDAEDVTKASKFVESIFKNRQNPESYDKFNKQIKNLVNKDDQSAANKAVDKVKEFTGYDLRKDILDSWTKSQFEKGDTNGARKSVLGGAIGFGVGSLFGPAGQAVGLPLGVAAGHTVDRYAGPIFKKVLDGKIGAQEAIEKIGPSLGKYAAPLSEAAKRGNTSLAATMFVLGQQDSEFRKLMGEKNEN